LTTVGIAALVGFALLVHERHSPGTTPVAADHLPPVFENSLGMKFRTLPGTDAKLAIWETRLRDWQAFASETQDDSSHPDDPVAGQPLPRIQDFCRWLTARDKAAGRIRQDESYRLPTDREWSLAAGLTEPADAKPEDLSAKAGGPYPWGKLAPAPAGAGNYADSALRERLPNAVVIPAYYDGHPFACAVGSFQPNPHG
ncbi:MAG: SUMF1/EgtB/PvdO family nonheme iron enzyme, partial [Akkermansiaceae bacterium]|nr:SUMF1/EgtB/PvdO family nonheme iron enzyme [Akkermansiaceae bacterium]